MTPQLYQFLISSVLSYLLVTIILPQLRSKLLDTPNQRSSHTLPTPRGGGIAFVIIGTVFNYIFATEAVRWVPLVCLPLAFIGMLDDYKDLPALWRYITQLVTAIALIYIAKVDVPVWEIPIFMFVITAIINFMNFMDGLDGILAGCSVVLFAAISSWSISGAVFGFLIWNWSPSKVFMGDVGSTFIGAVFAGLAFQQPTSQEILSVLLLGFPLFGDSAICIIRRLLTRKNIFKAHKQHLYQRLNQAGWSHSNVALLYVAAVLVLALARSIWGIKMLFILIFAESFLAIILDSLVARKFTES
jgi:UDP-N-acetylmuramyl pentapeptide phosphotransferase/UDP-N-acetylglucosamine-1-phosphate transferase